MFVEVVKTYYCHRLDSSYRLRVVSMPTCAKNVFLNLHLFDASFAEGGMWLLYIIKEKSYLYIKNFNLLPQIKGTKLG